MVDLILKFMLLAIIGYIVEVFYVYILSNKWVNRGYLNGPYIPIYAIGGLLIGLLDKYHEDFLIIFFMGMMLCSALEFYTSYFMEKLFHRRWWDYSDHKYHLNGRVCLQNSLLFGIGSIAVIYFLNPFIINILNQIEPSLKLFLCIIFLIIFVTDLIISTADASTTNININIFNKFGDINNKNISKIFGEIKIRFIKAYPNLINNNKELMEKIQKINKEIKEKTKKFKN